MPTKNPSPKSRPLTLRQQRFVNALPLAKSATEAAIIAGYSNNGDTATVKASQTVRNVNVIAALQTQAEAMTRATIATIVERKELLTSIQRAELPGVDMDHRLRAVDTHNRMDGLYIERHVNLDLDASQALLARLTAMMQGQLESPASETPALDAAAQVAGALGESST